MSTIDAKAVVNELYRGAVVTAFAIGGARIAKVVLKTLAPSLDFTMRDILLSIYIYIVGMFVKDSLVHQGTLPDAILK